MNDSLVRVSIEQGVAWVELNRPAARNAMNNPMKDLVSETFENLAVDRDVTAVVLKGAGKGFCAGADIKENAQMDSEGAAERLRKWDRMYRAVRNLPQPLVCQLHGVSAGAGFQIAMLADMRIASDDATFGMTELGIGSICILGSAILAPLVGRSVMREVVLMGRFIDAKTALSMHLVNEVVSPGSLEDRVAGVARELADKPAGPMALTKAWLREIDDALFEKAVARAHVAHAVNFESGAFSAGATQFKADSQDKSLVPSSQGE